MNRIADIRSRIAEVLYGDGNNVAWTWATQMADLIIWELGLDNESTP